MAQCQLSVLVLIFFFFWVCVGFLNMTNKEPQRSSRINKRKVGGFLIENFIVMISRLGNFCFTKGHYKGSGCLFSSWENN